MKQRLFYNVDLEYQEYDSFKLQKCFDIFSNINYSLDLCVAELDITDNQN